MLTADDLLSGPRGRGLCLSIAGSLRWEVHKALLGGDPPRTVDTLVDELGRLDVTEVVSWEDPHSFLDPMASTVSHAMYWEEPFAADIAAAEPSVIDALWPVAKAIVSAPAGAWWDTPVELDALRYTSLVDDQDPADPATLDGARDRLREWRAETVQDERRAAAERPSDPTASYSGYWWSTPAGHEIVTTTRPLPRLGSMSLEWVEDDIGPERAAIWSLSTTCPARVWEIDRPESWGWLVERYPLEVTHARRHDWYRTTSRIGNWFIPDWAAVADDWDAVHLSVAGYLTTATRSLDLVDGATLLAGWSPDETWWLNDVLQVDSPEPEWWVLSAGDPTNADVTWGREQSDP